MPITIYTKPGCPQCTATRRAFDRLGVGYDTVDVTTDAQALRTLQDAGFRAAPVIITDDDSWSGYRPDKIRAYARAHTMHDTHGARA
ncbi:glutaredoxin family protein [Bifidobacterium criceti]|uniref:Glutaredoxin n=1 Tax=Bifidobacterium criceti TaxID=1960969 RepID=A0A2A2EFN3_9BIFI|nr:glutaredoxin family protein [Bifidobacterium criceti]MEE0654105.1 glutaredoxin family protein [Bifidobacterium criceti]PAU67708.1 glutaredoxin [Bifidobacterium criceti]